jgi:hypothetical protein
MGSRMLQAFQRYVMPGLVFESVVIGGGYPAHAHRRPLAGDQGARPRRRNDSDHYRL